VLTKKLTAVVAALFITTLGGCAAMSKPDVWNPPAGGDQEKLSRDDAGCKLVAMGAPQQHTALQPVYSGSITTYNSTTNGNLYGNMYSGNTYGTATTTPMVNGNAALANGLAKLGDAIGNANRQREAYRLCMQSQGYTKAN
jgi:hypothetical protein